MKADSDDVRASVALDIWKALEAKGADISYHDPFVNEMNKKKSIPLEEIDTQDLILILTDHSEVDYQKILASGKPIIDMKNVYKDKNPTVTRL